jgi:hypothetical protein
MGSGLPALDARGVGDAGAETMGAEGTEGDGRSAVETADGPEAGRSRHCDWFFVIW